MKYAMIVSMPLKCRSSDAILLFLVDTWILIAIFAILAAMLELKINIISIL